MAGFDATLKTKDIKKYTSKPKIGILGAGIIGATCADKIIREFRDTHVTVISDQYSPNTTSNIAAGLWDEYLSGKDESQERIYKWLKESYDSNKELYFGPDSKIAGVTQLSGYRLDTKSYEPLYWKDIPHGFRCLDDAELKQYGDHFTHGLSFTAYTAECSKILPYYLSKFSQGGGELIKYKINSLNELMGKMDVVINCTGLGASHLLPDPSIIPIRGQIMKVKAPWIKTFIIDDSNGNYIIPNMESVILGGTNQHNDYNLNIDSKDSFKIWSGCCQLLPSIQSAKIIGQRVGLRPSRYKVRLERETLTSVKGKLETIHNYGHGGCGISIAWGCASDVVTHLHEYFRSGHARSKL